MYNFTPVFSLFLEYFRGQDVFPSLEEMSLIAKADKLEFYNDKNNSIIKLKKPTKLGRSKYELENIYQVRILE